MRETEQPPPDPAGMEQECREITCGAASLLAAADLNPTGAGVIDVLGAMPASQEELVRMFDAPDGSLLSECLRKLVVAPKSYRESFRVGVQRLMDLAPERRSLVMASIRGAILGLGLGR